MLQSRIRVRCYPPLQKFGKHQTRSLPPQLSHTLLCVQLPVDGKIVQQPCFDNFGTHFWRNAIEDEGKLDDRVGVF